MFGRRRSKLEKLIFSPNEIPGQLDNAKSVKMDGVDEYIEVPDYAPHRTGPISISFWFKDNATFPSLFGFESFIGKVDNDTWSGWNIYVVPGPNRVAFMSNGFLLGIVYIAFPNDNGWHHVVGTASGTQAILYFDGVATAPVAVAGVGAQLVPLTIGCSRQGIGTPGPPGYFVNTNMDEVSIWNAVLSPVDVLDLYNGKKPTNLFEHSKIANLVSWWRMGDADTFPTIKDVVNARDGTLTNGLAADIQNEVP